jgi:tetratricopeptide (TPR) repeat protein
MGQDRRSVLAAALIAAACLAAPAHAGRPSSRRAQAVKHFDQGEAYFLAKAYDKAALEYQAAYDMVPKPGLLFNIGLCRENQGDSPGAIEMYRRYLAADPRGNKSVEARARVAALEEKMASERRAAEQARRDEEARRAEEARRPLRPETPPSATRELAIEGPPPPSPRLLPGLIVLGGALGAASVGLVYQLEARSIRDDLDRDLDNGTPPLDSRDPRFDDGKSAALRSSIAYGIAGVAGAVGGFLTVRALLGRRSARRSLSVQAAGAGAALEVRW